MITKHILYLLPKRKSVLILAAIGMTIGLASGIAVGFYPQITTSIESKQVQVDSSDKNINPSSALPNAYPFASSSPNKAKKSPSSNFGFRIDPFSHAYKHHAGLDYSLPAGTPVLAAGDGKIKNVGYDQYSGQFIVIEHTNGYATKYAHLRAAYALMGAPVKQGQQIGEVGSTGRSTSPHLHFEISQNNTPLNPLTVLNQEPQAIIASNASKQTLSPTLQRVPFITNSGVTYRMVEVSQLRN